MKKLLVAIAAVLISASAFAQGSITFNNRTQAGDAKITLPDGVTGAGTIPGMTAELVLVGAGGAVTSIGTTTFRTTPAAATFFITGVDLTVAGIAAGSPATFQVRAYNGASYDASVGSPSMYRGISSSVTVGALGGTPPGGGAPIPTPDLSGLQAFSVVQGTPEPSTIALGVLGAAGLLLRRRRK